MAWIVNHSGWGASLDGTLTDSDSVSVSRHDAQARGPETSLRTRVATESLSDWLP